MQTASFAIAIHCQSPFVWQWYELAAAVLLCLHVYGPLETSMSQHHHEVRDVVKPPSLHPWFVKIPLKKLFFTNYDVQASDQDITAALQSIKALPWLSDTGEGWSLLHEMLLLDALEHILLTCVEHKLKLEQFEISDLLSAIQAENSSLSCAPVRSILPCLYSFK